MGEQQELRFGTLGELLARALVGWREALVGGERPTRGGEVELIDELLRGLAWPAEPSDGVGATGLADWLVSYAGEVPERRQALADVVSLVARGLAQGGDDPPSSRPESELWQALAAVVDRLFGSGVAPLGRLDFVSDRLLELLLDEARRASRRVDRAGEAGRVLASLAVSGKLRDAVGKALGFPVASTHRAVYLYDTPGSHVQTHVDTEEYSVVFHLVLEHSGPAGGPRSALVVHGPGDKVGRRIAVPPGEAVALQGRGMIHSWEPMGADEQRTLIAVGFRPAPAGASAVSGD